MNAILRVTDIQVDGSHGDYNTISILLENVGDAPVAPGSLIARRIATDGSAQLAALPCTIPLDPGEKARLSLMLYGSLKAIDFTSYEPSEGAMTIRVAGLLSWWLSPWSLAAA